MKKSMEPPSCQEGLVNIGLEAESKKLPSSIYKGVVPQPNGRWGAQIYDKHQRVWLGTFDEEEQAAHTYDIAALRFRGNNAITNFRLSLDANKDDVEHYFLNSHSKDEIVDMLRKHSYAYELEQTKYNISACNNGEFEDIPESDPFGVDREELFEKVLTPSDVGKLNRMVIPKQQAERYFPLPIESAAKGVLLSLEDEAGKVWRFRYCYWSSSQSYVLTKGWTRFVKEKNLKAGDRICFQRSGEPENCRLFIGCRPPQMGSSLVGMSDQENSSKSVETTRLIRLFGVNILEAPTNHVL